MEKLGAAFFKLLDELTIARSRKHIQKYYKDTIALLGGFPVRQKPLSIYPDIDTQGQFLSYDKLSSEIDGYKLSLFNPSTYLKEKFLNQYKTSTHDPFQSGTTRKVSYRHDEGELSQAPGKLCGVLRNNNGSNDREDREPRGQD